MQDAVFYLYTMLLKLQKHLGLSRKPTSPKKMPVLIAANKMDLFTAMPITDVKIALEEELSRLRAQSTQNLLDSASQEDSGSVSEHVLLGDNDKLHFEFSQLHEFNIEVKLLGGSVCEDRPDVESWSSWLETNVT